MELESEPLRSDVVAAIKKVIMLEIVNIVGVQVIVEQEDVEHVMEVVNMWRSALIVMEHVYMQKELNVEHVMGLVEVKERFVLVINVKHVMEVVKNIKQQLDKK